MDRPGAPTSQRPTGVTVLAVLSAIGGVLGLLGSLFLIGLGGAAGAAGAAVGGLAMVLGLITLILSVLYLVFAYGAWSLKPWAWTLGVGLSAVSIVLTLLNLVQGTQQITGAIISIAISGVILYYLFRPEIKAAFGRP